MIEAIVIIALGTMGLAAVGVLIAAVGLVLGFGRAAFIALTGGRP
jgi:hypothetical protein